MRLGDLLWQVRTDVGLAQAAFARRIGISQRLLSNMENGHRCSLSTLAKYKAVAEKIEIVITIDGTEYRAEL